MAIWNFRCTDNGSKRQAFTIKANSKQEAIDKAFTKARKNAHGDITTWECRLAIA